MRVENSSFRGGSVLLDSTEFINCRFQNVKLVFAGAGPVSLRGCVFDNVQWVFDGPASNTLQFLRAMYHGLGEAGRAIVDDAFRQIKLPPNKEGAESTGPALAMKERAWSPGSQ